jgi:adenylylsulfate kinase
VNTILQREEKEKLLNQKGIVIWMTGLSGSGKTTIGIALEKVLYNEGLLTQLLDGDIIREGINKNLGFSNEDRKENIRRIAEAAKLFVNCGVVTICCFVSPTEEIRNIAKTIIGEKDFVEVFINTSLEICEQRDVKGLYAKARRGEMKDFTGIDAPYQAPLNPSIEIKPNELNVDECVKMVIEKIISRIK